MSLSELHDDGDGGRRDRDDHSDLQTDNPPDTAVHAVQTAVHTAQAITDLVIDRLQHADAGLVVCYAGLKGGKHHFAFLFIRVRDGLSVREILVLKNGFFDVHHWHI